jgi:cytochrome c2
MVSRKHLSIWVVAALGASSFLVGVLLWEFRNTQTRWTTFFVGDPNEGAKLFFEKKHCVHCHPVNGYGGKLAPDLGFARLPQSGLSQLVSAMWNCAPRMWKLMRQEKLRYPSVDQEEMAHLFAFLYTARYVDESGDKERGQRLLDTKGCTRCHVVGGVGGQIGPDLSTTAGVDTPIRWAQAMWNHAPEMEVRMQELHIGWPKFEGRDMNDLLAYIREVTHGPRKELELLPANAERGWEVFQRKSCIACHSVQGKGGGVGPELGGSRQLPMSVVQFAALMWNHSPEMWRTSVARKIPRPTFDGQQIADLAAFLSSLHYFEPAGSALIGRTIFSQQGCSRCHGAGAEGDRLGPGLRGRGKSFTTITLATALWNHGPQMHKRTQELKIQWPTLAETDIGHLLSFLNSPLEGKR